MDKKTLITPLLLILATTIATASVFVYYPLDITAQPVAPGVVFEQGSNAGQPDIGAEKIIGVT
ncbi:MAG: hypothetical protein QXS23_05235, partial [Desulfurococcaceae archaeon]